MPTSFWMPKKRSFCLSILTCKRLLKSYLPCETWVQKNLVLDGIKLRVLRSLDSHLNSYLNSISSLFKPSTIGVLEADMDQVEMPKEGSFAWRKIMERGTVCRCMACGKLGDISSFLQTTKGWLFGPSLLLFCPCLDMGVSSSLCLKVG